MKRQFFKTIFLGLVIGLASGCAVMRVDVDVYKGPLADEEHIQIQRLIVMAVGAKPLLIQARDLLAGQEYIRKLQEAGRYQEKFIPDNLLLIDDIKTCKAKCKKACQNKCIDKDHCRQKCSPANIVSGRAFTTDYGQYDTGLKSARIINSTLFLYEDNASGEIKSLITEGRLALNQFKHAWNAFKKSGQELDSLLANKSISNSIKPYAIYKAMESDTKTTNNDTPNQKKILSIKKDYESILKNAEKLFSKKNEQKKFMNQLKVIDQAYDDAWRAQRKLLRITLLGIIALDKYRGPSSLSSKQRLEAAARLVSTIGQWNLSAKALGKKELNSEVLRELILSNPGKVARQLLIADAILADKKNIVHANCGNVRCQAPQICENIHLCALKRGSRPYGLVYVPQYSVSDDIVQNIKKLAENLVSQFDTYSANLAGFEKGRLPEGLETLIQLYLDEYDKNNDSDETKTAQKRLADALVRFSQKLIYVSQNSAYVDINMINKNKVNTKRLDGYQKRIKKAQKAQLKEKELENIFGIIEVVGNSILVQANELVARESYKRKMGEKYEVTRSSIAHEYSASKTKILKRILSTIKSASIQIKDNKEKLDGLKKILEEATNKQDQAQKGIGKKQAELASIELPADYQNHKVAVTLFDDSKINQCFNSLPKAKANIDNTKQCVSYDTELKKYMSCVRDESAKAVIVENFDRLDQLSALEKVLKTYSNKDNCKLNDFQSFAKVQFVQKAQKHSQSLVQIKMLKSEKNTLETSIAEHKSTVASTATEIKDFQEANPDIEGLNSLYTKEAIDMITQQAKVLMNSTAPDNASGHLVILELRKRIENLKSLPKHKTAASKALKILDKTHEPETVPEGLFRKNTTTGDMNDARKPIDALIKWLETKRIRIIHDQGKKSQAYVNVTNALEAAYRDRAGLTYIRPASSYLRSSYTSTAVQQSNHLEWDNMIGDSYKRNIPLLGESFANKGIHKSLNEIDKQYWQNINTVRVSGGGVSNYVLAKDDIGNWTVRSYTTNYNKTVDALKNMALFNYSQKLGTQLIKVNDAGGNISPAISSSGLNGVFANYQKTYDDSLSRSYQSLNSQLTDSDLAAQIKTKWDNNNTINVDSNTEKLNAAKTLVDEKYNAILKDQVAKLSNEEAIKVSDLIYDLLRAIRRFKAAVNDNLNEKFTDPATQDVQQAIAEAAKGEVNTIIDTIIKDVTKARTLAVANYERALLFIGEATNGSYTSEASTQE